MANSSCCSTVADLPGPGTGGGRFEEQLSRPSAGGQPVDLVFASLVETRLAISDYVQEWHRVAQSSGTRGWIDTVLCQNAMRESQGQADWGMRGLMDNLAVLYNGNLKTILAFSSQLFSELGEAHVYGKLPESDTKVAGLDIPNPKKGFCGRSVQLEGSPEGLRMLLAGAHFPVHSLALAMESPDPVRGAKVALARTLRKVMRAACRRGLLDDRTLFVVQGDVNSRTLLLPQGEGAPPLAVDVLLELFQDPELLGALESGLPCPAGTWAEVVPHGGARDLPVTYKFNEEVGTEFRDAAGRGASGPSPGLGLGDVLDLAQLAAGEAAASGKVCSIAAAEPYRRALAALPPDELARWGLHFKDGSSYRPFRFPSCADRVIYWAPAALASRISWDVPRGGYEVNHFQGGSDHRPVTLEVVLRIAPPAVGDSAAAAGPRPAAPAALLKELCQDDSDTDAG